MALLLLLPQDCAASYLTPHLFTAADGSAGPQVVCSPKPNFISNSNLIDWSIGWNTAQLPAAFTTSGFTVELPLYGPLLNSSSSSGSGSSDGSDGSSSSTAPQVQIRPGWYRLVFLPSDASVGVTVSAAILEGGPATDGGGSSSSPGPGSSYYSSGYGRLHDGLAPTPAYAPLIYLSGGVAGLQLTVSVPPNAPPALSVAFRVESAANVVPACTAPAVPLVIAGGTASLGSCLTITGGGGGGGRQPTSFSFSFQVFLSGLSASFKSKAVTAAMLPIPLPGGAAMPVGAYTVKLLLTTKPAGAAAAATVTATLCDAGSGGGAAACGDGYSGRQLVYGGSSNIGTDSVGSWVAAASGIGGIGLAVVAAPGAPSEIKVGIMIDAVSVGGGGIAWPYPPPPPPPPPPGNPSPPPPQVSELANAARSRLVAVAVA